MAHVHAAFPAARMFGVGFSIGANFITQYLGRVGRHTPLLCVRSLCCVLRRADWAGHDRAAVALANPFDCNRCMDALEGGPLQRHLYNRHFAQMLAGLAQRCEQRAVVGSEHRLTGTAATGRSSRKCRGWIWIGRWRRRLCASSTRR
jgi:predicted alpha/beta-fold hydrolase